MICQLNLFQWARWKSTNQGISWIPIVVVIYRSFCTILKGSAEPAIKISYHILEASIILSLWLSGLVTDRIRAIPWTSSFLIFYFYFMPTRAMFLVIHDLFYNISKPCCCYDKTHNFHTFIHIIHPKILLYLIVYEDTQTAEFIS